MFESSSLIQNNTHFELGSSAQLPLTKFLPVFAQNTYPSFKNLAQNIGSTAPAYIGFGPSRDPGLITVPQKSQKQFKPRKKKNITSVSLKVPRDYSGDDLNLLSLID